MTDNNSMTHDIHHLILEKPSQRALNDKAITNNVTSILAGINNRSLTVAGWTFTLDQDKGKYGAGWVQREYAGNHTAYKYSYELHLLCTYQGSKAPDKFMLPSLCRKLYRNALAPVNGKWTLSQVDGEQYEFIDGDDIAIADNVGYADVEIPDNFDSYFSHLYGLDAHIGMVRRALEAGMLSDWSHRLNCALIGPPGCGKSDLCASLKRALGEDAVLEFDATATTAAGAIKELAEREILPRVIVIEEIEKADEKSLSFLLAVLDLRGEIRKTTARTTIQRDTKLFAIATVNNYELFNKLQAGALASRFSQKIGFKRPSREQLAMILKREIDRVSGDMDWIEPTLQYCEEEDITDPRQVTAICMCGREMLLDGSYQEMLRATSVENLTSIADWTSSTEDDTLAFS